VCGGQPLGDLPAVLDRFLRGKRTAGHGFPERLPLEKLHDGVGDAVLVAEVVNRKNVRMRKRRDRQSLALEPRQGIGISGERLRQDLDRYIALELRVSRPVHLTHPACPERRQDFVGAEAGAGEQRHLLLYLSNLSFFIRATKRGSERSGSKIRSPLR
jgi:hypothetical protein